MNTLLVRTTTAAAFVFVAACANSATLNHYTSFFAFGDSLSDTGNFFSLTGETLPPSPPYDDGRFSNGPVWAEPISAAFDAKGLENRNYAYGFATAVPNVDPFPFQVPDLPDQIAAFGSDVPASDLGNRPLASLWFGANDMFKAFETVDPVTVGTTAVLVANAVADGIDDLAALGISDFLLFNLPPLELTPAINLRGIPALSQLAKAGTDLFNTTLASRIAGFASGPLTVSTIDVNTTLLALIADPGSLGLSDAVFPCYVQGSPPASACTPEQAATKVWFDTVHPTQIVHAGIADLVDAIVAPVPLPLPAALLLTGMLGLAAAGRRSRQPG